MLECHGSKNGRRRTPNKERNFLLIFCSIVPSQNDKLEGRHRFRRENSSNAVEPRTTSTINIITPTIKAKGCIQFGYD